MIFFKIAALIWFTLLVNISGYAQTVKFRLLGKVIDNTGKPADAASIKIVGYKKATVTDADGEFTFILNSGKYNIDISSIGYTAKTVAVHLISDTTILITLYAGNITQLQEVVVTTDKYQPLQRVATTQMAVERVTMKEAQLLPAIFGEVDIIKVLQLKPGIKSGGEGTAGIYVRGGGIDQNLFLVEGVPVYNPSHLLGFFSVLNQDAVSEVEVYKGGFPAKYGGKLSSVLDVKTNNGRKDKIRVQGGVGLISSRLSIDGPIKKNKHSFIVSGRRTYVNLITGIFNKNLPDSIQIPAYYFYDINARANFEINSKNRLLFNLYYGKDFFIQERINFGTRLQWGNTAISGEWKRKITEKLSINTLAFFAGYQYRINNRFGVNAVSVGSNIYDKSIKTDFTYRVSDASTIQGGLQFINHQMQVGKFGLSTSFTDLSVGNILKANEMGAYILHDVAPVKKLRINYGLRYSAFTQSSTWYSGAEPRLAVRYAIDSQQSIKFNYTSMFQYLHLVSTTGAALPTDVWYPSTNAVKPQNGRQAGIGYSRSLNKNRLYVNVEAYYKTVKNAVDLRDGARIFLNNEFEKEFVFGKARSYGAEAYIEKRKGRTTGWIGYTLAWTWREFADVNRGIAFRPIYDRRHDISIVASHKFNERITLSATWVFGSGNYISVPQGRFVFQDIAGTPRQVPVFTNRGNYHLPATHRMDVGLNMRKQKKWGEREWVISLYNAYSRLNPLFLQMTPVLNDQGVTTSFKPELVSLFPILPSVSYQFKFK
jgi:CarboxypepD_reg-like domain/TonB dependent receptor/TonB-dependent Receptor Plug Domain